MKIRKYKTEDVPIIHKELGCNPQMLLYTGWNPYETLEATREFIERVKEDYSWMIEVDGEAVGTIAAYDYQGEDSSIEIGYSIFQDHWGKGYASQAVALVVKELFSQNQIKCIRAWSAAENISSKRVLEKNGFVETEIREKAININGEQYNQVFYEKYGV